MAPSSRSLNSPVFVSKAEDGYQKPCASQCIRASCSRPGFLPYLIPTRPIGRWWGSIGGDDRVFQPKEEVASKRLMSQGSAGKKHGSRPALRARRGTKGSTGSTVRAEVNQGSRRIVL